MTAATADAPAKSSSIVRFSVFIVAAGLAFSLAALWFVSGLQEFQFTRSQKITVGSNPNHFYNVSILSAHIGAAGNDYIVRAEIRVKNTGAVPVNLNAATVKLVDAKDNAYEPTFPPDIQPMRMLTPQQAVTLWLDYTVPSGALEGQLALAFDSKQRVQIKNSTPLRSILRDGEFLVFKKLSW